MREKCLQRMGKTKAYGAAQRRRATRRVFVLSSATNKPPFVADFANTTSMRWHLCESHAIVMDPSRLYHAFPKLASVYAASGESKPVDYGKWLRVVRFADNAPVEYDFTYIIHRSSPANTLLIEATCRFCSYRVCSVRKHRDRIHRHFKYHLNMLYESKPFACYIRTPPLNACSATSAVLHSLQTHVARVHKIVFKRFSGLLVDRCIICNKSQSSFEQFTHHLHVAHKLGAIRSVNDLHYLNGIYRADRENPGIVFKFWSVKVIGSTCSEPKTRTNAALSTRSCEGGHEKPVLPARFCYVDKCRHVIRKLQTKQQPILWSEVVSKTYRRYVRYQQAIGNQTWREQRAFAKKLEKRVRTASGKTTMLKPVSIVKLLHAPPE